MNSIEFLTVPTYDPAYNMAIAAYEAAQLDQARGIMLGKLGGRDQTAQLAAGVRQARIGVMDARYRLARGIIGDILALTPGSLLESETPNHDERNEGSAGIDRAGSREGTANP